MDSCSSTEIPFAANKIKDISILSSSNVERYTEKRKKRMEIEKQRMWILIEILFMEEDKGSDRLMFHENTHL